MLLAVEYGVQQRVGNQEPCVLRKLPKAGGNRKNCHQRDGASDVAVQHPRTSLAHFGMGLIDQGTEEDVRNTVQQLGNCNQGADDAGVQTNCVGQVNHNEGREECVHHIACDVA